MALGLPLKALSQRHLGGSQTVTQVVTATATPAPTTVTATSTPLTTNIKSSPASGPTSSPLLFFVLLAILIILFLLGMGFVIYCCRTRKTRIAAREAAAAENELQPTADQPAPQSEVYGYYAPTGLAATGGGLAEAGKAEQEAAARELHGYFSPSATPRVGDGVVAR